MASRQAWIADLYDAHGAALYRHALMIVADTGAAEDAVHQVFVRLLRRGVTPDEVGSVAAYLRQAVRNECYTWLRGRTRIESHATDGTGLLEPAGPATQGDRVMLEQALGALPPEQREVVHLKVYEGLTFAEIAELTGVSPNTAASRYRYGIDKLAAGLNLARQKPGRTA